MACLRSGRIGAQRVNNGDQCLGTVMYPALAWAAVVVLGAA